MFNNLAKEQGIIIGGGLDWATMDISATAVPTKKSSQSRSKAKTPRESKNTNNTSSSKPIEGVKQPQSNNPNHSNKPHSLQQSHTTQQVNKNKYYSTANQINRDSSVNSPHHSNKLNQPQTQHQKSSHRSVNNPNNPGKASVNNNGGGNRYITRSAGHTRHVPAHVRNDSSSSDDQNSPPVVQ